MVYLQPSKKQYISHKKNTPVYYHFIFLILSIILNLNIVNAGHGDEIFWVGAGDIGDDTLDADTQKQTNPLKTIQHAISLASSTQQETVTLLVGHIQVVQIVLLFYPKIENAIIISILWVNQ